MHIQVLDSSQCSGRHWLHAHIVDGDQNGLVGCFDLTDPIRPDLGRGGYDVNVIAVVKPCVCRVLEVRRVFERQNPCRGIQVEQALIASDTQAVGVGDRLGVHHRLGGVARVEAVFVDRNRHRAGECQQITDIGHVDGDVLAALVAGVNPVSRFNGVNDEVIDVVTSKVRGQLKVGGIFKGHLPISVDVELRSINTTQGIANGIAEYIGRGRCGVGRRGRRHVFRNRPGNRAAPTELRRRVGQVSDDDGHILASSVDVSLFQSHDGDVVVVVPGHRCDARKITWGLVVRTGFKAQCARRGVQVK